MLDVMARFWKEHYLKLALAMLLEQIRPVLTEVKCISIHLNENVFSWHYQTNILLQ